jgi:hypothetical protein
MFCNQGENKMTTTTPATPETLISDEKFEAFYSVLERFGFHEDYEGSKEWFKGYLNNRANYFGGMTELCNRPDGIRLHIRLVGNELFNPFLSRDDAWAVYSEDDLKNANGILRAILDS